MKLVYNWCCDTPGCDEARTEVQAVDLRAPLPQLPPPTGWEHAAGEYYCPKHTLEILLSELEAA